MKAPDRSLTPPERDKEQSDQEAREQAEIEKWERKRERDEPEAQPDEGDAATEIERENEAMKEFGENN